jgi:D-alanyl-D-alanine carboxypeptidase (penicillin-binding protein 5/6)
MTLARLRAGWLVIAGFAALTAAGSKPLADENRDAPAPPAAPDSLSGPPFVAARHWAVAEARSGKILLEHDSARAADAASTTKIMTALVVLKLAEKNPELLDQEVTLSRRADETEGSSTGLAAGERLSARDLLHGLLIPSGNDAAVALAEHFGRRLPAVKKGADDALARFVSAMNRTAGELGLARTRYMNPHGLPAKGQVSSAADLVRLTVEARRYPLFVECVALARYTCEVRGPSGETRTVEWKSTNRLLAIEGYTGVKTGYTRAAGSCLVSTGVRNGDALIVVVLGAPSAGAAVADSRNLYRWAWLDRGHRE